MHQVAIKPDGFGGVICEIADGAYAGMKLNGEAILNELSFDEWATASIAAAQVRISRSQGHIKRLRLLSGKVTFPTRANYLEARDASLRDYRKKPRRPATERPWRKEK